MAQSWTRQLMKRAVLECGFCGGTSTISVMNVPPGMTAATQPGTLLKVNVNRRPSQRRCETDQSPSRFFHHRALARNNRQEIRQSGCPGPCVCG
jgi:hypothetical protein